MDDDQWRSLTFLTGGGGAGGYNIGIFIDEVTVVRTLDEIYILFKLISLLRCLLNIYIEVFSYKTIK